MDSPDIGGTVFEGAEYDYHIRWLGIKLQWKSRIFQYNPPYDFIDIQIRGPYSYWGHTHRFENANGKTIMTDIVKYGLPFRMMGRATHSLLVREQLEDIFCFRAMKINQLAKETTFEI
jgi:ligand-binding SRPBCC domain-containing protein